MGERVNAWNLGIAGRLMMGHGGARCMIAGDRRRDWPCLSTRALRGDRGVVFDGTAAVLIGVMIEDVSAAGPGDGAI